MKYDNPIIISKDTTPYLFLTEHSGIYLNEYNTNNLRYISIPINNDLNDNIYVSSIQFWVRYPQETFSSSASMIKILSSSSSANLISIPESINRSKIEIDIPSIIWKNGYKVNSVFLYPSEWTAINISFPQLLDFSLFKGEIRLEKGFVFNNIAIYTFKGSKQAIVDENNKYIQNGEDIYNQQLGTSLVSVEDIGSISIFSNGIDIFTDVSWQKFDKNIV